LTHGRTVDDPDQPGAPPPRTADLSSATNGRQCSTTEAAVSADLRMMADLFGLWEQAPERLETRTRLSGL